jgi:uncharacterized protein YbjQ (UPF0145 family)
MIVVTCDEIPGYRVVEVVGLVRGNAVRARHVGKDILAFLRNLVGGEVHEYTKMLAETREQALDRMIEEAEHMGANAVVTLRMVSAEVSAGVAELLAYGTGVRVEPL